MADDKTKRYLVPAVIKASEILDFVSTRGTASLMDVVSGLHLPKTSAYQLLNTLVELGLLSTDDESGGYSLGLKLFTLGNLAIRRMDIRREALPIMRRLAHIVNHTCHLGILDETEAVYLAKADAPESLIVNTWVGKRFSPQTTAMGKVLLAWRNPEDVRSILVRNPPKAFTSRTILEVDAYMAHLEAVRGQGFGFDDEENVDHVRCLAVPIRNRTGKVIAALSISAMRSQITDEMVPDLVTHLKGASMSITEHLLQIGR